jgi:hypothetical protein
MIDEVRRDSPPERAMDFPDLAPWFDAEADAYDEIVAAGDDVAYDE